MRQLDSFGCPFRKRKSIPDQKGVENNDTRRSIDIPNVEQKTHRSGRRSAVHHEAPQFFVKMGKMLRVLTFLLTSILQNAAA
jgi:hypothetical protein